MHKKEDDEKGKKKKKMIIVPVGIKLRPHVWKYISIIPIDLVKSIYNSLDLFLFRLIYLFNFFLLLVLFFFASRHIFLILHIHGYACTYIYICITYIGSRASSRRRYVIDSLHQFMMDESIYCF